METHLSACDGEMSCSFTMSNLRDFLDIDDSTYTSNVVGSRLYVSVECTNAYIEVGG